MVTLTIAPLDQSSRPLCSIPLADADLGLGNANWTKGLQAMSDWIWSGNLNPVAFPNNLARYFLQVPGIFEQQLAFSTTLIFDEPSFRNGIQVSGFIERPIRELVINLIGQRRRSWYTMTHHAVLSTLTARKHGIPDKVFANKLVHLTEHRRYSELFTPVEREALKFADAFATNPKEWGDGDCDALKGALLEDNRRRYESDGLWMARLEAARAAHRGALANGDIEHADDRARRAASEVSRELPNDINDRMVNAQLVELAFLCLQFVALTDVFSGLNIPDEGFLPDVMTAVLQPEVIARINELNGLSGQGLPSLVPPPVQLPIEDIIAGRLNVEPASLKGARVPLVSYEIETGQATRDKGLAVGGVQVGVWGWSFGSYFPGGLIYLLMHHPELARFEAPYSLPLLFNEDEWRNGTQTAGFVTRRLKEIAYLKIYTTTRARYGLEHHTMFLFNVYLDEYGVGRSPNPPLDDSAKAAARGRALKHAENVVIYAQNVAAAPRGTYTDLELATMEWVERLITHPHSAHEVEARLRDELAAENVREVNNGTRMLDVSPGLGEAAAHRRLVDHQISELAMLTGHMDGLGRAMTMLRLESEDPASVADGYMTDRPSLFQAYGFVGVTAKAQTANELRLNPNLLELLKGEMHKSQVSAHEASETGEF
jgi:alkylhydroperoxidase family enzyme